MVFFLIFLDSFVISCLRGAKRNVTNTIIAAVPRIKGNENIVLITAKNGIQESSSIPVPYRKMRFATDMYNTAIA
jgi:hypothetical protein